MEFVATAPGGSALGKVELLSALKQLNVLPDDPKIKNEFFLTLSKIEGTEKKPAQFVTIDNIEQYVLDICSLSDD